MKRLLVVMMIGVFFLIGCSAKQHKVFQDKLFAWDNQNVETARQFADQILGNWDYNYAVIEEFLGGKLDTEDYVKLKTCMDKIKKQIPNKGKLTKQQIAVVNVNFGKFLINGGQKLIENKLPQFLEFVSAFRAFFGIV